MKKLQIAYHHFHVAFVDEAKNFIEEINDTFHFKKTENPFLKRRAVAKIEPKRSILYLKKNLSRKLSIIIRICLRPVNDFRANLGVKQITNIVVYQQYSSNKKNPSKKTNPIYTLSEITSERLERVIEFLGEFQENALLNKQQKDKKLPLKKRAA